MTRIVTPILPEKGEVTLRHAAYKLADDFVTGA